MMPSFQIDLLLQDEMVGIASGIQKI